MHMQDSEQTARINNETAAMTTLGLSHAQFVLYASLRYALIAYNFYKLLISRALQKEGLRGKWNYGPKHRVVPTKFVQLEKSREGNRLLQCSPVKFTIQSPLPSWSTILRCVIKFTFHAAIPWRRLSVRPSSEFPALYIWHMRPVRQLPNSVPIHV